MFNKIAKVSDVQKKIETEPLVFVYIGQQNCSVCHSLKPQVEKILSAYPEIELLELDALESPIVAEAFQVLTVPVLLLYVEGREYLRKARIVNTNAFKLELEKIVLGFHSMKEVKSEDQYLC